MHRPRYPIGDPRHRFTKEEAKNETIKYVLEKIDPVTKVRMIRLTDLMIILNPTTYIEYIILTKLYQTIYLL